MRNVEIKEAIHLREQERLCEAIASRTERQRFWSSIMRNAEEKTTDRLKASELLGRSECDFSDRVNIDGSVDIAMGLACLLQEVAPSDRDE